MRFDPILIVAGEPNSIFLEIFFKCLKKKIKSPLILIASLNLVKMQMNKLKVKKKIKILDHKNFINKKLNNKMINLINIDYNPKKSFEKITTKSNNYIKKSFDISFKIIKQNKINKLINGPIYKKTFLNKKYLGITEYISKKFKVNKKAMLIYNEKLSVCPVTNKIRHKKNK